MLGMQAKNKALNTSFMLHLPFFLILSSFLIYVGPIFISLTLYLNFVAPFSSFLTLVGPFFRKP